MRKLFVAGLVNLFACVGDNSNEKQENIAPTILITSHSDGVEVQDGYVESFQATVSDEDNTFDELQIAWYVGTEIVCDWAVASPAGDSSCDIVFVEGDERVSVEARDPLGAAGNNEISVVVLPTEAPFVEILSPLSEGSYYSDLLIQFSALVSDEEDEGEDLLIQWSSSIEGDLSVDTTINSAGEISDQIFLQEGNHAIELRVEDSTGKISIDEVVIQVNGDNRIPTCSITEPLDGTAAVAGETVRFRGTALDEDIPATDLMVEWVSDKDGVFGSSIPSSDGSISYSYDGLSSNEHTVMLNVYDEVGALCSAQILLAVGNIPEATIDFPLDGAVLSLGESISFQGRVLDQEDSEDEITAIWTSSLDGELYSGLASSQGISQFSSSSLSVGVHSLTLTAVDSVGLVGEDTISFRINTPPEVNSILLSPDPSYSNDDVTATIVTSDQDGDNVTVTYAWYEDGALTSFTGNTISSFELDVGEVWIARVTPNDGYQDGNYLEESITISNTSPVVSSVSISSSDGNNSYNDSVLTCSATVSDIDEAVSATYSWDINGNTYLGASLDLSTVISSPMDIVVCEAQVIDSQGAQASSSTSLSLDNRVPSVSSISFTPNPLYWNQDLFVNPSFVDEDGDNVTAVYAWYEDGVLTSFTGASISASELDVGEVWTARVTPNDGYQDGNYLEESITVDNQGPSVSAVTITPSTGVLSNTELTCIALGTDPEEGSLTPSYEWFIGGSSVGNQATLQLSNQLVSPLDSVECVATVVDSSGASIFASNMVVIENSNPVIDSLLISPNSPNPFQEILCSASATDIDGGEPSLSFSFQNTSTGVAYTPTSFTASDATLDLSSITILPNEVLECSVIAVDTDSGSAVDAVSTNILWGNPLANVSAWVSGSTPTYSGSELNCTGTATNYHGDDISQLMQLEWVNLSDNDAILSSGGTYIVDPAQTNVGDVLDCVGTITDQFGYSWVVSNGGTAFTIQNSAPYFISNIELSNYAPNQGDLLDCQADFADSDDPNFAELQIEYAWYNVTDGQLITTDQQYSVNSDAANMLWTAEIGDEINCTITLTDIFGETVSESSSNATVQNSAPVLSNITIIPNNGVFTGTEISCSAIASDLEDGDLTSQISYEWTVNSSLVSDTQTYTIDASETNIGDVVLCTATVIDSNGEAASSSSFIFVEDTPVVVSDVVINPNTNVFNDSVLICSALATDPDEEHIVEYFWLKNGNPLAAGEEVNLADHSILPEDQISCVASANDSTGTSEEVTSVDVENRAPELSTPSLSNYQPASIDTIICSATVFDEDGETLSETYAWEENSTGSFLSINGENSSSLDISSLGMSVGEEIRCVVSVADNYGDSAQETSASAEIVNIDPVFDTPASITPNSSVYTGTQLNCSAIASDHEDGTLNVSYSWTVNGVELETTSGYIVDASETDVGDTIVCTAMVTDLNGSSVSSSASVLLENTAPVITEIEITSPSGNNYNDETLSCLATASDVDDSINISYSWEVNGFNLGNGSSIELSTTGVMPGNEIACIASVSDGYTLVSDSVLAVIGDRAPPAPTATISWTGSEPSPTHNDNLSCAGSGSYDPDGFAFAYFYTWSSDAGGSASGETLSSSETSAGEVWTCTVTASDGSLTSTGTDSVTIEQGLTWDGCETTQTMADAQYQFVGEFDGDVLGRALAPAGDVDGDGLDDILIAAPFNDENGTTSGKIYLLLGSTIASNGLDITQADYIFYGENADDRAGYSVSTAGDVDGDGLDDILIGAHWNSEGGTSAGKVYLILGSSLGSSSVIDLAQADYSFVGEAESDYLGASVSSAGDIDGDGLDDIMFSAHSNDSNGSESGKTYVILGMSLGSSSSIDLAQADYFLLGEAASDRAGNSISSAGDVDGDGLSDILIGAYFNSSGGTYRGRAYLVLGSSFGGTTGINLSQADYIFYGEKNYVYAGRAVSSAGDVDGDGLDDILISAYNDSSYSTDSRGATYLILGASLGQSTTRSLGAADYTFTGENDHDHAGYSISSAGDVDNDGLSDILIGAYWNDDVGTRAGKAYLILGSSLDYPSSINARSLSEADYSFLGETASEQAGQAVSSAGDINGDNLDEILITAAYHAGGGVNRGKVSLFTACEYVNYPPTQPIISVSPSSPVEGVDDLVCSIDTPSTDQNGDSISYSFSWTVDGVPYSGGTSSTSYTGDTIPANNLSFAEVWECTVTPNDGGQDGTSASISAQVSQQVGWSNCPVEQTTAQASYQFFGEASGDLAGSSVVNIGDVDGDNLDEILIGAHLNDDGGANAGKIYLFLGSSISATGRFDLSQADYTFIGENPSDYAGYSVSSAGDVDGDGLSDILISADRSDAGGTDSGKVYLILGSSLGSNSAINLSQADYSFIGEEANDFAGESISSAGDVDNDGLDDILIGAYGNDESDTSAGKVYLILGSSLGSNSAIDLSNADYSFLGENINDSAGNAVSSAGDVDNDGLDDILIGGYFNDDIGTNSGKVYLILGSSLGGAGTYNLSQADYSFVGEAAGDQAGFALSGGGDVDGDGLSDILISADRSDAGGTDSGKVYLILGSSLGSNSAIDLSQADYSFVGEEVDDAAGWSVSFMNDANGDGLADILIGAIDNDAGGSNSGITYLIFTSSLGGNSSIDLSDADHFFIGENDIDDAGYSVSAAGDLNGDGLEDIMIGVYRSDENGDSAGKVVMFTACEYAELSCVFGDCDENIDLGNGQYIDMKLISAGSDPQGRYSISSDFYLMNTEVTQGMFYQLMGYYAHDGETLTDSTGSYGFGDRYAAIYVSWDMAADFANAVTLQHNLMYGTSLSECYSCSNSGTDIVSCTEAMAAYSCDGYRLPTEGEWEYAARAGSEYDFWSSAGGGNSSDDSGCSGTEFIADSASEPIVGTYSWYCGNNNTNGYAYGVKEVAQLEPNGFGLYDIQGNTWELTTDWLGCSYPTPSTDPICDTSGVYRIARGGAWNHNLLYFKMEQRNSYEQDYRYFNIGARLARTP